MLLQRSHQRMTHLVVCHHPLFHIRQHGVLLLRACDNSLEGDQQILLVHRLTALADCPQRRFVDQVGKVCAHGACRGLSDLGKIHILRQTDLAGVHLQSVQSALKIGSVHDDPAVKTTGTEQRLIQYLRAVGGRQNDHALGRIEAVDLAEELVQGLVVAAHAGVSGSAHGVDLIDKDDAGGDLGGLPEQIPDTAGAHAHEHLLKIRAGDGEEGHIGFACHRLGDEGLAGTGGTHQQRTLGQLCADVGVLLGVVEEVDDLLQRFLGFVLTCHIFECDAGLLFHVDLGLALPHAVVHGAHPLHEHLRPDLPHL